MYNAGSSFNTSYAWFAGGATPNRTSNTTRLDYANDLTAPAPKGDLTLSRDKHAGTGNQNYGYHSGGATLLQIQHQQQIVLIILMILLQQHLRTINCCQKIFWSI